MCAHVTICVIPKKESGRLGGGLCDLYKTRHFSSTLIIPLFGRTYLRERKIYFHIRQFITLDVWMRVRELLLFFHFLHLSRVLVNPWYFACSSIHQGILYIQLTSTRISLSLSLSCARFSYSHALSTTSVLCRMLVLMTDITFVDIIMNDLCTWCVSATAHKN